MLFLAVAPLGGARLVAQAQIFGEEPVLDPMRKSLKEQVVVLRDSLYAVDAVAARLVRAKVGNSPAVIVSAGRMLRGECARSASATGTMRKQFGVVGTNDKRGMGVIADYAKALVTLESAMSECEKSLGVVYAGPNAPEQEKLFRVALASADAIKKYESQLSVLLKTLQIPLDPKGFKSAINL